jgi:organic radical activating enzyme
MSRDKLEVLEVFPAFQGEGIRIGSASIFVRFVGCPLHCVWCDTKYARDQVLLGHEKVVLLTPARLADLVLSYPNHLDVVLTGGEPLLQDHHLLEELATRLCRRVSVETSGSIVPDPDLLAHINLWSFSPKLSSSGNWKEEGKRDHYWNNVVKGVERTYDGYLNCEVQLKFVVDTQNDIADMLLLCNRIRSTIDHSFAFPPLIVQPVGPNSTIVGDQESVHRTNLREYASSLRWLEENVREHILPTFPFCRVLPQLHKIIHGQMRLK